MKKEDTCALLIGLMVLLLSGCAAPPAPEQLTGTWQGMVDLPNPGTRVELEIRHEESGDLGALFHFPDHGALKLSAKEFSIEGNHIKAATASGDPAFEGLYDREAGEIAGEVKIDEKTEALTFRLNHPDFRKFAVPRLTSDGKQQTEYAYQIPPSLDDGWDTGTVEDVGIDETKLRVFMTSVLAGTQGHVESVVVAKNGKLVIEEYFHGFTRDKPHTIQSITKSVTSLLFGIAMGRGMIKNLDTPAHIFFSDYSGTKWIDQQYDITLRHLLTMSAALDWNERAAYGTMANDNTAMNRSPDWIGYVLDRDLAATPGEMSVYCSGLTILLGGILKNTTTKYVDEFADETLFAELGITDYTWGAHADGTRHTGGGLRVRPRDMAKIGQLVLDKGKWRGKGIVNESWIEESTGSHLPLEEGRYKYSDTYGYQWWRDTYNVNDKTIEVIGGHGYGGQYLGVIPSLNMVVVLTAGEFVDMSERTFSYFRAVEAGILPAVGDGATRTAKGGP